MLFFSIKILLMTSNNKYKTIKTTQIHKMITTLEMHTYLSLLQILLNQATIGMHIFELFQLIF